MKVYNDLSNYTSNNKTFVTIGTFDGVHIGHRKVIQDLIKKAKKQRADALLLTFFPHPRMVLQKEDDIKLINTIDERIKLLEKTGLKILLIHEFSEAFSKQTALDFVRNILVNKLNISKLIVGYDHHFGKNRSGDFEQLKEYGHTYGFKVKRTAQQNFKNFAVSSTKIRNAIENGDIYMANKFLGYCFMLSGKVIKGKNLGEKLGFPTANLFIKEPYKLIPKTGAYVVKSEIDNKCIFGMMNIGYRPTVSGKHQTIEIHFFNFKNNLYGKKIQVDILHFLRDEQKFESVQALKNQLVKDKKNSLSFVKDVFSKDDHFKFSI